MDEKEAEARPLMGTIFLVLLEPVCIESKRGVVSNLVVFGHAR